MSPTSSVENRSFVPDNDGPEFSLSFMFTPRLTFSCLSLIFCSPAVWAAQRSPFQPPTSDAAAWWAQVAALSSDEMEGREAGTAAYDRAAKYVANQFSQAGLLPGGEGGTFFQQVAMHQVDVDSTHSTFTLVRGDGHTDALTFLQEWTVMANANLPREIAGAMTFLGYGLDPTGTTLAESNLTGKVAVYFNGAPANLSLAEANAFSALRSKLLRTSGAIATVAIANPANLEPTRWPYAYARTVTLAKTPAQPNAQASITINAESAAKLFGATQRYAALLRDGKEGKPLPSFPLPGSVRLHLVVTQREISSSNIIAVLPGSDPVLAGEYVALSAHLDGYGYGTPVNGDSLYNGTLDDAAYVATLTELARETAALPEVSRPRRSLLFCIFTAEEKGLLGSAYFTANPTVGKTAIVANLNLDQLRPIFPLRALTMHGLTDSTLGDITRSVAGKFGIEIRPDLEPSRRLPARVDSANFAKIGVPFASFIFAYDLGSPEEAITRDWFNRRYHRPQDDLETPIDWDAAVKFNRFYGALALAVANSIEKPAWLPASPYAPRP